MIKLIENAGDAMSRSGQIHIRTQNHEIFEAFYDGSTLVSPGVYVGIEVNDSGQGIPPETLPRIFEPFFTTKSPPHRGLGLAFVYGIVSNHSGTIAISSEVGKGTSVRIYLPAERKLAKDRSHSISDLHGSQTVLLIDDEQILLTLGEMILVTHGYRVLTADNGRKGLELYRKCANDIDVVITDLVMPDMSGRELIEKLREHSPNVRVILTSGVVRAGIEGGEEFLQKPYTAQNLLRKVKHTLEHL